MTKVERLERIWRNFVPLIAVAMALYSVHGVEGKADKAQGKADRAQDTAARQQEGRRVAVDVLCGGIVGVENAGRLTLLDKLPNVPHSQKTEREKLLRAAWAKAYTTLISKAVIAQAGIRNGSDVLSDNGQIDCDALKRAARTTKP